MFIMYILFIISLIAIMFGLYFYNENAKLNDENKFLISNMSVLETKLNTTLLNDKSKKEIIDKLLVINDNLDYENQILKSQLTFPNNGLLN